MRVRLLGVGFGVAAWLGVIALFGAVLQRSASTPLRPSPSRDGVTALARSLNQLRRDSDAPSDDQWTVTKATSALRELVVEIEAVDPGDAARIARFIVDPVRQDYDEVLVYVRGLDTARDPVVRRIEWTPGRGFIASEYR